MVAYGTRRGWVGELPLLTGVLLPNRAAVSNLRSNEEYIAPSKAKAISRLIVTLCSELRGVALQLVRPG